MSSYSPNTAFFPLINGAPTGLVGDLTYAIELPDGTVVTPASSAAIVEVAPGAYIAARTTPGVDGGYLSVWHSVSLDVEVTEDFQAGQADGSFTANTEFFPVLSGAPTGLTGDLTYAIEHPDGTILLAASSAGIVELSPGFYVATRTSPPDAGTYVHVWYSPSLNIAVAEDFDVGDAPHGVATVTTATQGGPLVLTARRGDITYLPIDLANLAASTVEAAAYEFTAKLDPDDPDSLTVIHKTGDAIRLLPAPAVGIQVTLQPADTEHLPWPQYQLLFFDVQMTPASPAPGPLTVATGQLVLSPDISRD